MTYGGPMNAWLKKNAHLATWVSAAFWTLCLLLIVVRMVAF
jgi:hypothetical protein